jgi:flagellin-like hook-associated protein FlgL
LQNQILTNTKIGKASDDPAAASKIALTKSQLSEYTMYSRSITSANLQLNSMESSLAQVTSRMQRANELITEASNEISNLESIKPLKSELEEILKTIVTLSNAQVDGQYIFSGANTTTPAYKIDDNGNIIYQGSNPTTDGTTRQLEISDGVYVPLNQAGNSIFGEYKVTQDAAGNDVVTATGIIGAIQTAINAMEGVPKDPTDPASELVVDYATIRDQIDVIKNESGLYNINVDCNSKEGKMLIEVVEKESSLKKLEDK